LPESPDPSWMQGDLAVLAGRIPGVQVIADLEGREAARFDVQTSGQALLYDASGALRFQGGITPARGHEGDSVGRKAILDVIDGSEPATKAAAVFGCEIVGRSL